jgi:hypothetical protein
MAEVLTKRLKTTAQITPVVGADVNNIDNWIGRLELSTKFEPSRRGRERQFTRENTIELAIVAALVQAGLKPQSAAAYADMGLRNLRHGGQREWLIFPAGDATKAFGSDQPDPAALAKKFGAVALSFVHVGEIVRRVEELFSAEGAA